MEHVLARYERLSADLAALRSAGPFARAYRARRLGDAQIAEAALAEFQPALPLTVAGGAFAGAGFLGGLAAVGALLALLKLPFRWRRAQAA